MRWSSYLEITFLSEEETPPPVFASAIIEATHRMGVAGRFAIAFPELHGSRVGDRMRIFSDEVAILEQIREDLDQRGLTEMMDLQGPSLVPDTDTQAQYRSIKARALGSKERRRIRRAEAGKNNLGAYTEEDLNRISQRRKNLDVLPYLRVRSLSTDSMLRLHIEKTLQPEAGAGTPNSYGFAAGSNCVTVPEF